MFLGIYITINNLPDLDFTLYFNLHNNKQFTRFRLYHVLGIYITINNLPELDFTLYFNLHSNKNLPDLYFTMY
jgi:hypothetical protein